MKKNAIRLYVNEPMGRRWQQNLEAAGKAAEEFGSEVVIISKLSQQYLSESDPPPCPSVAVDNSFIVKDGTVSYEDLKTVLNKAG